MTTNKEKVQLIKWFAAKTKFSAEKKIKQFLERLGIEHYIPFRTVIKEKGGKKVKVEKPVIPNLIFIHSDYNTCLSLVNEYKLSIRAFEFIEKGPFHLNGRRLLLRGTHRHEDHAGVAAAMTEDQRA